MASSIGEEMFCSRIATELNVKIKFISGNLHAKRCRIIQSIISTDYYIEMARVTYKITKQWDGAATGHDSITVSLCMASSMDGVTMRVSAPFFNDPGNPGGESGEPFPQLWDYEVVEAFFLNDDNQYLEVEVCPHGQHQVLMLNGVRQPIKDSLPLNFGATIKGSTWEGLAMIPAEYFPPRVTRFNAYAIHGSGDNRMYEALYPAPQGKHSDPDFHRLEYFQPIDLTEFVPGNEAAKPSELWTK